MMLASNSLTQDPLTLDSLEQDLLRPISQEQPAGPSVRLEASFEELDRLIKSVDSLTATTSPDWPLMSRQAQAILSQESKDLLVAVYWSLSLAQWKGAEGLAVGLQGLVKLLEQFWDSLHPEKRRVRARVAALEWLVERLSLWLEQQNLSFQDREFLRKATQALAKLQAFCAEHLAGQEPEFAPLTRVLRQQDSRLTQTAAPQGEPPASPVQGQSSASLEQPSAAPALANLSSTMSTTPSVAAPVAGPSSASQATATPALSAAAPAPDQALADERSLRDYLRQLQLSSRSLGEALLRQDVRDPRAYEINRTMTWAAITQLPQAKEGVTALKSVPLERRQLFQSLREQARHEALILELEKSFANAPFWLDSHYLVCESLTALEAEEARHAVENSVACFMGRFPQLMQFKFADGVPFATEETRDWINSLHSGSGRLQDASTVSQSVSSSEPFFRETTGFGEGAGQTQQGGQGAKGASSGEVSNEILEQARQLARNKALPKALALLQDHCRQAASEAQHFHRQLRLAEFCLQHKLPELARAQLEDLDRRLQEITLFQWEPELSAWVMQLLLLTGEKSKTGTPGHERQLSYFNRLCLLDVAKAIEFRS